MNLRPSRLRHVFDSRGETEAQELQDETEALGATPVSDCSRGVSVRVCGVLRSVTISPRAGTPALEAQLYDGSGAITLVWLGRRRIAGIEAGRSLIVEGRLTCEDDNKTLFNPRYELRAGSAC